MDSKTTANAGTQAPTPVQAGTKTAKLTLTLPGGKTREFTAPKGFFATDDAKLDLSDEGQVTVCDHTAKEQAARKLKMAEHADNTLQNVLLWIQPEGSSGKYAAIISCGSCKVPVRRFTSDLHQARFCMVCAIKAKRSAVALKRAEKRQATRGE